MALSLFLKKRINKCKELVALLKDDFKYVSILGNDTKSNSLVVDRKQVSTREGFEKDAGFVIKISDGDIVFEYATFDLKDLKQIKENILKEYKERLAFKDLFKKITIQDDEELTKDFVRKSDVDKYQDTDLIKYLKDLNQQLIKKDQHILNAYVGIQKLNVSKIFVSKTKCLTQQYTWINGYLVAFYKGDNGKIVNVREGSYSHLIKDILEDLPKHIEPLLDKAEHLTKAKSIKPGVYDIISHPSISGLIAHEAFGHGVEMDQFTKNRALAQKYVNDYVASPVVNMKDGAASAFSTASYFFDDDGILAQDTQIIKDGILVGGLCDLTSATILNYKPTGNGRREKTTHKAYTRMTNTFFEEGQDDLDEMIKSIKHGFMLFETNNGMEDPKNWGIQCTCEYGIEIIDGKLTDNYYAPIVLSGNVLDLLKSITMVSKGAKVIGSGSCGKGYKEWVRVSDGGPYLKGRVKLS